jgi:DNA-binding MarR family transcriptional regulator
MAILVAVSTERQVTFGLLKGMLGLTDGNLGAHLRRLEEVGYVTIAKAIVRQKPQTYVEATELGRRVFDEHREALKQILGGA